jgi:hypothetical protein
MSFEESLRNITKTAGADLTTKQYLIMTLNGTGQVIVSGVGATNIPTGVLQNNPPLLAAATIGMDGVTKVKAGGVVTPGAQITSDANGQAVVATTGDHTIGIAQNLSNTASGDLFPVLLKGQGKA